MKKLFSHRLVPPKLKVQNQALSTWTRSPRGRQSTCEIRYQFFVSSTEKQCFIFPSERKKKEAKKETEANFAGGKGRRKPNERQRWPVRTRARVGSRLGLGLTREAGRNHPTPPRRRRRLRLRLVVAFVSRAHQEPKKREPARLEFHVRGPPTFRFRLLPASLPLPLLESCDTGGGGGDCCCGGGGESDPCSRRWSGIGAGSPRRPDSLLCSSQVILRFAWFIADSTPWFMVPVRLLADPFIY
jgi:hypothetical protein